MSGMFSIFKKLHVCINEFLETQMCFQVTQEFCWRLKRCWHSPAHSPLLSQGIDPTDWLQLVTLPEPLWEAIWTYVSTKVPALRNGISKYLGLQLLVSTRPLCRTDGTKPLQISINCPLTQSTTRGKSQLALRSNVQIYWHNKYKNNDIWVHSMSWSLKTVGSLCPVTNNQISSLNIFYVICELTNLFMQ